MISVLKMMAKRMRFCGGCQPHNVERLQRPAAPSFRPIEVANIAAITAKYSATSLAIENVVSVSRVIRSRSADFDDLDELVG